MGDMRAGSFARLPWPPSVNAAWRAYQGRNILSKVGRAYRKAAVAHVHELNGGEPEPLLGPLAMTIRMHPPDRRRRDVDNHAKAVLDACTHAGVWSDDSQVRELHLYMDEVSPRNGF